MPISAFIALIVGIINQKKYIELRVMIFYPFASLVQSGIFYYWIWADDESWMGGHISISIFIIIEFFIFFKFFDSVIIKSFKKYIRVIAIIFFAYLFYMWIFTDTFYDKPFNVYLFQALSILCFCFMYLFQIFKLPPTLNLLNSPPFWITIGCLFYFSCTAPLFFAYSILIFLPYFYSYFAINYLSYSILFLLIAKSFLCTPIQIK